MSLIPLLFDSPSRLFHRRLYDEDLFSSAHMLPGNYYRPWRSRINSNLRTDAGSKLTLNKDKYQICLDVQQFTPEEITVKTVGREIIVEGKHEEKEDEHGTISRHFIRKYIIPEDCKNDEIQSTLSSDGVLTVVAPRLKIPIEDERIVTIVPTGVTHKAPKASIKESK